MEYNKKQCVKSPLNYTGGKSKLLPQILPLFPDKVGTFIDLFCGGCNVGSNVNSDKVIYNDYMSQIIELFKNWKDNNLEDTIQYIETQIEKFNLTKQNQEGFLELRKQYNEHRDIRDLFVLVAYAFNHQIRFNSKGEYNMPFGKERSEYNKNMKTNLINFITRIQEQDSTFLNKSFEELNVEEFTKDTFVYADPPYLITVASYNENGGWNEQMEYKLLEYLDKCTENGIKFALSNVLEMNDKSNDILKKWVQEKGYNIHHLNYTYGNCNYHKLDKTVGLTDEVLITNY
jgi:DNA adenine methylase